MEKLPIGAIKAAMSLRRGGVRITVMAGTQAKP